MAVSTIKSKYKITDLSIALGSLSWTSAGMWFARYTEFEATGTIVAITITGWGALSGITSLFASISGGKYVGLNTNAKPTSGSIQVRVVEII